MNTYERFQKMKIDFACLGIQQLEHYENYYCTPKDAVILGSAGVDGIHYCTIPEFGEMIFAVSPMNFGDCVHPIARNFGDLLRLLLFCADMAFLEQCYAWDKEEYKAWLIDCPATKKQAQALAAIQAEFGLEPMEDAFAYVKQLQREFDLSKIPYTEDFYDIDMNPAAPKPAPEWKVTFQGDFHSADQQGTPGIPVRTNKEFHWAGIDWVIPEVYAFEEGLVVLTLGKVDPVEVRKHIHDGPATQEDIERMDAECPLNIHLRCTARINGSDGVYCGGSGMVWMPPMPGEGNGYDDARWVLEHYGFDTNYAWIINRDNYRWPSGIRPELNSLEITITQRPVSLSGTHFKTPVDGNVVKVQHPLSGKIYTLTIEDLKNEEADMRNVHGMGLEFPTKYTQMEYRIEPELVSRQYRIMDCKQSDEPRPMKITRAEGPAEVQINGEAATIGIIGGADGPTAVFVGRPASKTSQLRMASSSMRFEHVDEVEWRIVFLEKLHEDITIQVI